MAKQIIQIPEDLQTKFDEICRLEDENYDRQREFDIKVRQLWFDVESRFNIRGKLVKYNKKDRVVEVVDDSKEEDRKMLDKIREGKAEPYNPMGSPLPKVFPTAKKPSLWKRIANSFKS